MKTSTKLTLLLTCAFGAWAQVLPLEPIVANEDTAPTKSFILKSTRDRKAAAQFDGETHMPIAHANKEGDLEIPAPRTIPEDGTTALEVEEDTQNDLDARELKSALKAKLVSFIPAAMDSPRPGATLPLTTTFRWAPGSGATEYYLWVGSCRDCTDLYDASTGRQTSASVNLPTDGRLVYVTLFTLMAGDWYWFDYTYVAPDYRVKPAEIFYPANGATIDRLTEFQWTTVTGATAYHLRAGTCRGCANLYEANVGLRTAQALTLPRGVNVYLTLYSHLGGRWVETNTNYFVDDGMLRSTRLNITNKLIYSINITVNGRLVGSVPANSTRFVEQTVARFQLGWELVRPTLSNRSLGDAMSGRFGAVDNPGPAYNYSVDNVIGSGDAAIRYFAPIITNRTPVGLLLAVNSGYATENRCNCVAGAFKESVAIGYYQLHSNSNVRGFRDSSNYTGNSIFWGTANGEQAPSGPLHRLAEEGSGRTRLTANTAP